MSAKYQAGKPERHNRKNTCDCNIQRVIIRFRLLATSYGERKQVDHHRCGTYFLLLSMFNARGNDCTIR